MDDGNDIYWGGDGLSGGPPPKWAGCVVLPLLALLVIGAVVHALLEPRDILDSIMGAFWAVFIVLFIIGASCFAIRKRIIKCRHGVRGGAYRGRCRQCAVEKEARIEGQRTAPAPNQLEPAA
jgi:hypothetical protein